MCATTGQEKRPSRQRIAARTAVLSFVIFKKGWNQAGIAHLPTATTATIGEIVTAAALATAPPATATVREIVPPTAPATAPPATRFVLPRSGFINAYVPSAYFLAVQGSHSSLGRRWFHLNETEPAKSPCITIRDHGN